MNNLSKTKKNQKLNVMYVFSNNNQVYVKNTKNIQLIYDNTKEQEEWFPVPFQWKLI
ncbi:hypothetical protein [Aquimarina addita]|uniref:hypothetical protein n=1 Tax=Aquimarina addita TaxID=870485 RepID=UPI0031EBB2ED